MATCFKPGLWVADQLSLLLELAMKTVVVDGVYDEMTSGASNPKDKDVKNFIDANQPPFIIEETDIGRIERATRARAEKPKKNAGEIAIADFMSSSGRVAALSRPRRAGRLAVRGPRLAGLQEAAEFCT